MMILHICIVHESRPFGFKCQGFEFELYIVSLFFFFGGGGVGVKMSK